MKYPNWWTAAKAALRGKFKALNVDSRKEKLKTKRRNKNKKKKALLLSQEARERTNKMLRE